MQYLTAGFEANKFDIFFVRWNFNLLELLQLVRLIVEQLIWVPFVWVVLEMWSRVALTPVADLAAAAGGFTFYFWAPHFIHTILNFASASFQVNFANWGFDRKRKAQLF